MAVRSLPEKQRNKGIFWGAFGAVALRVGCTFVAAQLLLIPLLQFGGGILLLWIAWKLLQNPPGAEGLKAFVTALRVGFPDWNCSVQDMFAAGDKVVGRYLCQGTQTGELFGLPPSGRHVQFSDTIIHKIVNGKVAEDWSDYDTLGYFVQLGFTLLPPQ